MSWGATTPSVERRTQLLRRVALADRQMEGLFRGLLDENELAHLAKRAVVAFQQNVEAEVRIEHRHLQAMAFCASPVERIHRIVGRAALHTVKPTDEGLRTTARELFVQDADALV